MKVLKIIRSIFVWLMVALAACMMIFTIVSVSPLTVRTETCSATRRLSSCPTP